MRILVLAFVILFIQQGMSQKNVILNWGPYHEKPRTIPKLFSLGNDFTNPNNFLTLSDEGKIEIFNKSGSVSREIEIIKTSKSEQILSGFRIPDKAYIFTKTSKNEVLAYKINLGKYELRDPRVISEFYEGEIKHVISEDSSKIAFYNLPDNKEKVMKVRIVDSLLKRVHELDIPFAEEQLSIQEALLSNSGTFSIPCIKPDGYIILSISRGSRDINKTEYKYDDDKALPPVFTIKGKRTYAAICYNKSNYEQNCLERITFVEYSDGKQTRKKEIILEKCMENHYPIRLIAKNNDEIVLINELFLTKENYSNNQVFYGSFTLMNFSFSKGGFTWEKSIFKNHYYITSTENIASPHSDDYKRITGHKFFNTNGKFYFLYNDNCSNCMNNGKNPMSLSAFTRSCLHLVSVDKKTGAVNRHYYAGKINDKYLTNINNCILVNEKFVIVESMTSRIRNGVLQLN